MVCGPLARLDPAKRARRQLEGSLGRFALGDEHVPARRGRIVATCADGVVRLFGNDGWTDVGTENPVQQGDNVVAADRLLQLWDGAVIDLERRVAVATSDEYEPEPVYAGDRGVVLRGGQLVLLSFTTGESLALGRSNNRYFGYRRAGPVVAAEGQVADLERFRHLGSYSGEALAVATSGQVLVAERQPAEGTFDLPTGPLRWIEPR